ncbi:DUF4307 domain-containing protein [Microlunatus antarcticus]|uniref:DUF4307 domain-containing protein n=1 Tax=Microlunatus antarcticus TaxID=53388 RepID=A0A7W5P8G7_9ACTN|nr:hypothetical protein [Microlunatus antarcticus]
MTEPTTVDAAAAERLARRYPPPLVKRRTKILITAVATLVALGWLVWAALLHAEPAVAGQVASYQVVSDTAIDVVITVQRSDPSRPATCRLLAQSTDFQPVAERDVPIEAGTVKVVDTRVTLTTLRRATSATVRSCTSR